MPDAAAGRGDREPDRPDKGDRSRGAGCRSGSGGGWFRVRSEGVPEGALEGGDAGRRAADERAYGAGRLGATCGR